MAENEQTKQGERLKKIRKSLGLNQETMADSLKVLQPFLSRLERGESAIPIKLLSTLFQFAPQINLTWLITGHGNLLLGGGEVSEPPVPYGASVDSRLRDLELRVSELEKALKRLGG
jgi:transcriptional regulator with XRE-family HTH domain